MFEINSQKTRLSDNMQRQEVTGLVINKKISVKREYIKNTRAMAFKLYKDEEFEIDGKQGTIDQLTGRFAFIFQISQYNNYLLYKKSLIENNFESQKNLLGRNLLMLLVFLLLLLKQDVLSSFLYRYKILFPSSFQGHT